MIENNAFHVALKRYVLERARQSIIAGHEDPEDFAGLDRGIRFCQGFVPYPVSAFADLGYVTGRRHAVRSRVAAGLVAVREEHVIRFSGVRAAGNGNAAVLSRNSLDRIDFRREAAAADVDHGGACQSGIFRFTVKHQGRARNNDTGVADFADCVARGVEHAARHVDSAGAGHDAGAAGDVERTAVDVPDVVIRRINAAGNIPCRLDRPGKGAVVDRDGVAAPAGRSVRSQHGVVLCREGAAIDDGR